MNYHKKTANEANGITALQNIQDLTKSNPKTEKYYSGIKNTARAPEQAISQEQLKQELDSYSNINSLQAIRKKIYDNYRENKEGKYKNDLINFISSIDDIMSYHKKTADDATGIKALQNIRDLIKTNSKTEKYYSEIKNTARAPEQAISQEQLKQELDSYSNINSLQAIRSRIDSNFLRLKESEHKNDLHDFISSIDDIMSYHKKTANEATGITALQNIQDLTKSNPKTEKYYDQMQEIAREQKASKDSEDYLSLQSQLQAYIDNPPNILPHTAIIPLVQEIRKQIREVSEKSDKYLQNLQNDNKRIQFKDHITDINTEYKELSRKFGKFKEESRSYNKEEIKEIVTNTNALQQAALALVECALSHTQQTPSEDLSTFIKQVRRKQQ